MRGHGERAGDQTTGAEALVLVRTGPREADLPDPCPRADLVKVSATPAGSLRLNEKLVPTGSLCLTTRIFTGANGPAVVPRLITVRDRDWLREPTPPPW
jgi:hypothetical protein